MTRSGKVAVYNVDTGRGVIVTDDDQDDQDDRFEVDYKMLPSGVAGLLAGQRVTFEVSKKRRKAVRVEPVDPPAADRASD